MPFGEKLKQLREENGISQDDIAKLLNLHRGTISKYETGSLSADDDIKKRIADYFGVSLDWMFDRSNKKFMDKNLLVKESGSQYLYEKALESVMKQIKELDADEIRELSLFIKFLKIKRSHL